MTSQIVFRSRCFARIYLNCNTLSPKQCYNILPSIYQVRFAGHAKWQNIAKTKQANDLNKCKVFSRYAQLVYRAVLDGGRQPDPRLNGKLAAVLQEASKMNVPKANVERAILRAMSRKIVDLNIELQGPGGCAIVVRCQSDDPSTLRRDMKKLAKKFDARVMPNDSLITMFQSRGFIRASSKTKDNRDVSEEFAEDAAIIAGAEEVEAEAFEDANEEEFKTIWLFHTDANNLDRCKGELDKAGLKIMSSTLDLIPYRKIDFGPDIYEQACKYIEALTEHEHVLDVYHNIMEPKENES